MLPPRKGLPFCHRASEDKSSTGEDVGAGRGMAQRHIPEGRRCAS